MKASQMPNMTRVWARNSNNEVITALVISNYSRQGDEVVIVEADYSWEVFHCNVNDLRPILSDDRVL